MISHGLIFFDVGLSLALVVFTRVDGHGNDDDEAFDDILQVGVDADEVQTVSDNHEDQCTKNDAWHCTYTAVEGETSHDTSSDSIQLVTFTGSVGC